MDIFTDAVTQLMQFVKDYKNAIGGAFVSFLVAQDFNIGRFVAGLAAGVFCAAYFTDWLLIYLPLPADMDKATAHSIAGALWGLTGYVVISTGMIFVQQKVTEYLAKAAHTAQTKGGE